jgi:hypothetical protein
VLSLASKGATSSRQLMTTVRMFMPDLPLSSFRAPPGTGTAAGVV